MTEITGDAVKGCALTSTDDHVRRMIDLMKRGARVSLTDIPGDPTFLSSSIPGGDARKIAERILAALDPSPRVAALEAENARMQEALGQQFCVLFLDGRNEHGTHVLASYPRSFDVVDDDISEQAEAILQAAESEGFQIGQHVWAEFDWVSPQYGAEGRVELSGYWDFRRVNVEMTRAALSTKEPTHD